MLFSVIKLQQQELIFARSHISPTLSSDEAAYELLSHLGVNFALSSQAINLLETTLAPKVNVPELLSDPMTRSCGHSHIDNVQDYVELADIVATSLPTHFLPEGQKIYSNDEIARMWIHLGVHYVHAGDKDRGARYLLRAVERGGEDVLQRLSF